MRSLIKATLYLIVVVSGFALFASGRHITSDAYRDRLANAISVQFPLIERVQCARSGHDSKIELGTLALTIALADLESYARPRWMRLVKYLYVAVNQRLFDRVPDLSIGPAQIRISNIRQITKRQGTMSEWIDLISDECANMSIAYCYVEGLRAGRPLTSENIAALAQSYNGQRRSASAEGSLQYVDLASRIFSILRVKLESWDTLEAGAEVRHQHLCL